MRRVPDRPDADQLRRHARGSQRGANPSITLGEAQLRLARAYGFSGWMKLRTEVERRRITRMRPRRW